MPVANFNAAWDAVNLNKALLKSDKATITSVLCKRSLDQRMQIASAYKHSFGKTLIDEIKTKTNGSVKCLYAGLLTSLPEYSCSQLKKAKNRKFIENLTLSVFTLSNDGLEEENHDNEILIEMMCVTSNGEIRRFLAIYQQLFNKRLEQDLRDDKSGNFKRLLSILSALKRDETGVLDLKAAKTDAYELNKNLSKSSIDKKAIIDLLAMKSFKQIKLISEQYEKLTNISLDKSIKKNISDTLKEALVAIVRVSRNPSEYYARRINKVLNNRLDGRSISRLIISRSEVDMLDVKEEFKRIFRKTLKSSINATTHGSLRNALLTLCGETK